MKKILVSVLAISAFSVFADNNLNSNNMNKMYFDFGLGVGSASQWNQNSLAINAMTMGFYMNKYLGVEAGMDVLPDGNTSTGQAMAMTYHLAAKGILPLSQVFSLYGKAGLGVNAYEGEMPSNGMVMANQASLGLYYAGGMQFNLSKNFAFYLEGSSVAVPQIGGNGDTSKGSFGSTYMGTVGLEVRI